MHLYLKENSWSNKEYHDYINIDRKYNGYEVYLNAYVEPLEKKEKDNDNAKSSHNNKTILTNNNDIEQCPDAVNKEIAKDGDNNVIMEKTK